jgi:hypothetical protein
MLDKIKDIFKFSAKNGLWLPAAYDKRTDGPSVSLLFAHVANALAIGTIAVLAFNDLKTATYCAMTYSALMLVFYLMRSLGKVKVDVDDGEIELDSNEENNGNRESGDSNGQ